MYRLTPAGALTLLTDALAAPNGIAFSPDERTLYVSNVRDPAAWFALVVAEDGTLGPPRLLRDATPWTRVHAGDPDGIEIAADGTLFAAGPGGVRLLAPDGAHLGLVETGGATSNVAFGDDGSVLYVTAGQTLYRLPTTTHAARW